jgi:aminobenzoyl-glutamate utilization protein B
MTRLKEEAIRRVDSLARFTRQMTDQLFSYGELGFQEGETSRYLIDVLRREGFTVEENVAGIPTAWVATWGRGRPVIALGADLDGIPQASQKPGVAYRDPLVPGAPGHGEGHNAGQAVNITAAIAVKRIMQRDGIQGTLKVWPGVAEEQLGAKAYFVRAGVFRDVDVCLFAHVDDNLATSWGSSSYNALVSVLFSFEGRSAHAAGSPWAGRSALDAVQLMDIAWNFRREHLRLQQRSHSVIVDGGDQPNVVPQTASVWYYLRETDYPRTVELLETATRIAEGAAMMTETKLASTRILGSAWPPHFNRPLAEAATRNIQRVGLPRWTDADQTLARALQRESGGNDRGLATRLDTLAGTIPEEQKRGGGSDDIGDVSWNVPTISLRFPSNIPGLRWHSWETAVAMATPIAHKGATAGAKAQAMTILDILLDRALVDSAWRYFRDVQTKDMQYKPLMRANDRPATHLNAELMAKYREQMRRYYYDPTRYETYLEQLRIAYPTVRAP